MEIKTLEYVPFTCKYIATDENNNEYDCTEVIKSLVKPFQEQIYYLNRENEELKDRSVNRHKIAVLEKALELAVKELNDTFVEQETVELYKQQAERELKR